MILDFKKGIDMKYVIGILLICMSFAGCSDDDPAPNKFMPASAGDYWAYSNYSVDTNGIAKQIPPIDSLVYLSDTIFLEHNASKYRMSYYNPMVYEELTTDIYTYETDNQLYVSSSFLEMFMTFVPLEIESQWIKLADRNASSWDLFALPLNDIELPIANEMNIILNGKLKFEVSNDGYKMLDLSFGSFNASAFSIEMLFDGTFTLSSLPIPVPFKTSFAKINYYFIDNIGLSAITSDPQTIGSGDIGIKTTGFKKLLEKYNKK